MMGVAFGGGARRQQPRTQSYLLQPHAEAAENLLHVAPLLHGDDPQVVLLVHPYQEALVVVVPRVGCSERPRGEPGTQPASCGLPKPRGSPLGERCPLLKMQKLKPRASEAWALGL